MKHKPLYSKTDILVYFRNDAPKNIESWFSDYFGYELLENKDLDWEIYRVKDEKIKLAMKKFLKYEGIVEWVEIRDLRMERRFIFQNHLENLAIDLAVNESKKKLISGLEEIKKHIAGFKDSKIKFKD